MRIVVASGGRAHLLDCARELLAQGHDVMFYSYTRKDSCTKYNLPIKQFRSILPYVALPLFLYMKFRWAWAYHLQRYIMNYVVAHACGKCDVFICQSPHYTYAMNYVKKKYNSTVILDRGSSHVRYVNELVKSYAGKLQPLNYIIYDENQYKIADYIAIACDFVKEGFEKYGIPSEKMFVNPYGVSLKHFYPTTYTGDFDVIYVGTWSQRKGVLILMEAFKNTDIRVLHVGGIKDVGFPQLKNFVHIDPVPENTLLNYYRKAQIFVFPSYDDGFGLVLLQAAACGLPIVCSPNCGGSTLKRMIDDKDNIYVMNEFSPKELEKGVFKFLNQAVNKNPRNYVGDKLELFSWKAYGERYDEFLHEIELKKNQL